VKRTELRPDPTTVREWMRHSRKPLKRTARKSRTSHREARSEAFRRSGGRCIVCGARAVHGHHTLPVEKWPELTDRADCIVALCETCHARHHSAHRRIRWEELPACVITLAYAHSGSTAVYLEKMYPRG
jgi:hypothetical protein